MSQRIFRDGPHEILTGWDRPLQYFFLVITHVRTREICFSNLRRENPAMTLDEIRAVLARLQITVPATLYADLEEDRAQDIGNLYAVYGVLMRPEVDRC